VSEAAVTLARSNAARLGLDVEVRKGDLLEPLPADLRGHVDLLISNPPYVTREDYESLPREVKADPYEALVGGTRFHRRLVRAARGWLRPDGWLVVEIGQNQGEEVRGLFDRRLSDVEVLLDLAGRDRVVRGRLATAR
jgi:release factor glutamine methyltransferase